ncbi:hypothetical protein QYE76_018229 [Lolium multiflorum]|uniref:Uncharacterized protein n=1 Tax=Lolium multiflorum TaxID=4521 RepID=A0AAD8QI85_LOLMU|nr:hypothetical protein QYE76_018229 [Lolium multiflorum]
MAARPGLAAPPGVSPLDPLPPLRYIKPLDRKPRDVRRKPRNLRATAITTPRCGASLCSAPLPDGNAPEGFSIDTAAISTAIFITAAAPMRRSSSPSRLGAVPVVCGLHERDIFDLFLPEFDKPWVIHLRENFLLYKPLLLRPNTYEERRNVEQISAGQAPSAALSSATNPPHSAAERRAAARARQAERPPGRRRTPPWRRRAGSLSDLVPHNALPRDAALAWSGREWEREEADSGGGDGLARRRPPRAPLQPPPMAPRYRRLRRLIGVVAPSSTSSPRTANGTSHPRGGEAPRRARPRGAPPAEGLGPTTPTTAATTTRCSTAVWACRAPCLKLAFEFP